MNVLEEASEVLLWQSGTSVSASQSICTDIKLAESVVFLSIYSDGDHKTQWRQEWEGRNRVLCFFDSASLVSRSGIPFQDQLGKVILFSFLFMCIHAM